MARMIDLEEPGTVPPGDPGYVPPPQTGSRLAVVTSNTNFTFTPEMIAAAGGPWASFKLRVTPVNDAGPGTSQEVEYP